ncbi:MAG: IS66 family insertion sequence element accessory protein TnpA [Aristaeellaceae bacterium]
MGIPVQGSVVKCAYQRQEWSRMLREWKESGRTVKNWCAERVLAEHAYCYRFRNAEKVTVKPPRESTRPAGRNHPAGQINLTETYKRYFS